MQDLGEVLRALGPHPANADVLVGLNEPDDAAVMRTGGSEALVFTTDFFTPVVDDAYDWGRIAAANAISDVYAMGGRPLWALNIVGWPRDILPLDLLADVLRGGAEIASAAGMVIVGGHTVDDPEPKYGMSVVGMVDPDRTMTIDAAREGNLLVLTKPIGTGIITTALKRDAARPGSVQAAVESMTTLNDATSRALVDAGVRACTDVTGFGLLGHLHRMMAASGVAADIQADAVPLLPGAREMASEGIVPGGTERNLDAIGSWTDFGAADEATRYLLADPQTSGGLLAAVPDDVQIEDASVIGSVVAGRSGAIAVRT